MNDGYVSVLNDISSDSPTPGGGTVAALTLAHANSLALMVARLTLAKEKWLDGHIVAEKIIRFSEQSQKISLALAKADADAFDKVMSAYRLPKSDGQEKEIRNEAILSATIGAANTPLSITKESFVLLSMLPDLARFGNSNAITDLASASELAYTAIYIASLNVKINVDSMNNEELNKIQVVSDEFLSNSKILIDDIRAIVAERMS
tara:strand:- start:4341 stop:4958 length:618 start_codon:yes stop_codon:yes gene_type:complete